MNNIDLLIDKLKHILTIIPENHPLTDCLQKHITSCFYCAPEAINNRILLISESLAYYMGEPNNEEWKDWQQKVYQAWMQPLDNSVSDIDEPTELEDDIDSCDSEIILLSQKDGDSYDI